MEKRGIQFKLIFVLTISEMVNLNTGIKYKIGSANGSRPLSFSFFPIANSFPHPFLAHGQFPPPPPPSPPRLLRLFPTHGEKMTREREAKERAVNGKRNRTLTRGKVRGWLAGA